MKSTLKLHCEPVAIKEGDLKSVLGANRIPLILYDFNNVVPGNTYEISIGECKICAESNLRYIKCYHDIKDRGDDVINVTYKRQLIRHTGRKDFDSWFIIDQKCMDTIFDKENK